MKYQVFEYRLLFDEINFVPIFSEIVVAEEIQNSKKNEQFEQKLKNIKELLVSYDMTFKQILESLSMNQMSINDLRDSLTAPATTQAIWKYVCTMNFVGITCAALLF